MLNRGQEQDSTMEQAHESLEAFTTLEAELQENGVPQIEL